MGDNSDLTVDSMQYFQQISFDSLRFHYSNTINELVKCKQRLNLYFRIAGINKGSEISRVFHEKFKSLKAYYDQKHRTKTEIEREIFFYWSFAKENVDVERSLDKSLIHENLSEDLSHNGGRSEADKAGYSSEGKTSQIKLSKTKEVEMGLSLP